MHHYPCLLEHMRALPWISSEVCQGQRVARGNDYFLVVVDRLGKMFVLTPCKKTIKAQETAEKFHEMVWIQFYFPKYIVLDRDTRLLSSFSTVL